MGTLYIKTRSSIVLELKIFLILKFPLGDSSRLSLLQYNICYMWLERPAGVLDSRTPQTTATLDKSPADGYNLDTGVENVKEFRSLFPCLAKTMDSIKWAPL